LFHEFEANTNGEAHSVTTTNLLQADQDAVNGFWIRKHRVERLSLDHEHEEGWLMCRIWFALQQQDLHKALSERRTVVLWNNLQCAIHEYAIER